MVTNGAFEMSKKGMVGPVMAVIGVVLAGVVAIIGVQIYNSIYNTASLNGSSKTVASNIPVFIFLGVLILAALGVFFATSKR